MSDLNEELPQNPRELTDRLAGLSTRIETIRRVL
jgi:hypothetical protein